MHRRRALILSLASLLGSAPAWAHHSFSAIFDSAKPVTVTGTVNRIEWMNPHTWIYLDVKKDDGTVEAWAFEMGSPNRLMRYGWNQDSLPTGTTVSSSAVRLASVRRLCMSFGTERFHSRGSEYRTLAPRSSRNCFHCAATPMSCSRPTTACCSRAGSSSR